MPKSGGLQDVEQVVSVDASKAVEGYDDARQGARDYATEAAAVYRINEDLKKSFREVGDVLRTTKQFWADDMNAAVEYGLRISKLIEGQERLAQVSRQQAEAFRKAAEEQMWAAADAIEAHRIGVARQAQAQQQYNAQMIQMANDHIAAQKALADQIQKTGDAFETSVTMKAPALSRAMEIVQKKIETVTSSVREAEAGITRVATSPEVSRIMAASSSGGGYAGRDVRDSGGTSASMGRILSYVQADATSRRYSSVIPALVTGGAVAAAMTLINSPGVRDAASRVGGAAAGAAGNVMGAVGGAFAGGPSAGMTADVVGGFIKRWYPAAHWAMMLTNELLATVGPATVAAGMGGLVGMQGFEQLVPRGRAVFNTAESLGGSLGTTTGQAWGLKTALLQNAQDLATGSATQLAGAGINMIKAGAGGPFVQLGQDTTSMIDRFAATLTQDFQTGGLGGKLGGMVGGGAGYLQQIGDTVANLGKIFLNLAPNLPGVGGDLLSTLSGGLGGIAHATGFMGSMMAPILAGEAGLRWGPALVGGAGRGIAGVGNILGNAGRGGLLSRIGVGTATATGMEGGLTGLGAGLAGLGAPQIAAIAAGALLVNKGYTYQTPEALVGNQMVAQVGQMGIPAGIPQIIANMRQLARYPASQGGVGMDAFGNIEGGVGGVGKGIGNLNPTQIWGGIVRAAHGALQLSKGISGSYAGGVQGWGGTNGMFDPSGYEAAQTAMNQLSKAFVSSLSTGSQVQQQWKGLSGDAVSMSGAFDVATMAQLQLGSAFEKNGKLTSQAKTMIGNLYAGYAPMQMNTGQFGAAVGAQTAMAGLQHTQVAAVNTAYDQLLQTVTGGAAGASGFFGMLGGAPVSGRRGNFKLQAPPAMAAMAQALTSFTTGAGAGAWNTLVNPQTGLATQLGSQTDWLRTMQTMGALAPGQTRQMAAFQLEQLLPMAQKSPGALATLSTIAQEFGGPAMTGGSQQQNFRNMANWVKQFAANAGTYNANMNAGMVAQSNIPRDAQQFTQQVGSGIAGALATGLATHGASLQDTFLNSLSAHKGKGYDISTLENYGKFLAGAGVPKSAAVDMARYAAQLGGAGPGMQSMIARQLSGLYAKLQVQVDTASARAAIANLTHLTSSPKITVKAEVAAAQAAINAIKGKSIPIDVRQQGVNAVEAAINAIHGKSVTVTITTINRMITQLIGANTAPGNPAPATLIGGPANMRLTRGQTGMKIPGYGGGDIFPAMLEPGELVVPKHLVGAVAPILSGKIPGFADGGGIGVMDFQTMLQQAFHGQSVSDTLTQIIDGILKNEIPKIPRMLFAAGAGDGKTVPPVNTNVVSGGDVVVHPRMPQMHAAGMRLSVEVLRGLTEGIKNAKGAARTAATAMMNHIAQELQYAKSTASGLTQGMNFGGMDTTQGPVQTQMKSYADSLKAFSGDIKAMTKGGLNKDLLKQMIAAGPVQGDLLAQSISQGPGGIKAVNALYSQIQHLSKGIAAQGASAIYGGKLNPDLKSGTFVNNNVSISISMGGGPGDLSSLTTKELNQLVAKIQAALLKQAKRNRKTGVQLAGKSA